MPLGGMYNGVCPGSGSPAGYGSAVKSTSVSCPTTRHNFPIGRPCVRCDIAHDIRCFKHVSRPWSSGRPLSIVVLVRKAAFMVLISVHPYLDVMVVSGSYAM